MVNKDLVVKGADITANIPPVKIGREDIRKHFCPLASDKEVAMGLAIIKSLSLNPFLREVHFIKYSQKDKMAIVVGYEVYLKRAERSGKLNGWKAGINTEKNFAWVKIWRKDWAEPFEWTVNLDEFNKKQSTWKQIPSFMGRKVAIAQGFRLCFPDELGGLPYTEEEHQVYDINHEQPNIKPEVQMPKAISDQTHEKITDEKKEVVKENPDLGNVDPNLITVPQQKRLFAIASKAGMGKQQFKEWLAWNFSYNSSKEITKADYEKICQRAEMYQSPEVADEPEEA